MPGFEDIFGGFDDIVDENISDDSADEWDAGGLWDTGEKENIWRTSAPSAPGDVWSCGGGCGGCEDEECESESDPIPDPVDPVNPIPDSQPVGPMSPESEYDEMDQFDHLIDGDDPDDEDESPATSSFDDIW